MADASSILSEIFGFSGAAAVRRGRRRKSQRETQEKLDAAIALETAKQKFDPKYQALEMIRERQRQQQEQSAQQPAQIGGRISNMFTPQDTDDALMYEIAGISNPTKIAAEQAEFQEKLRVAQMTPEQRFEEKAKEASVISKQKQQMEHREKLERVLPFSATVDTLFYQAKEAQQKELGSVGRGQSVISAGPFSFLRKGEFGKASALLKSELNANSVTIAKALGDAANIAIPEREATKAFFARPEDDFETGRRKIVIKNEYIKAALSGDIDTMHRVLIREKVLSASSVATARHSLGLPPLSTKAPQVGHIRVIEKSSGRPGTIPENEFDPNLYDRI